MSGGRAAQASRGSFGIGTREGTEVLLGKEGGVILIAEDMGYGATSA